MIILIDNYDSFTYNLVHYFEEIGQKVKILRNDKKEKLQLHAREIMFKNPLTKKLINIKCSPPDHMKEFLNTSEINKF